MSMSKTDFADLAATIRTARSELGNGPFSKCEADQIIMDIAENLAILCHRHNPRFERARFLAACSITEPVAQDMLP